jgi:hypothetical protein
MTEQPGGTAPEAPDDSARDTTAEPEPVRRRPVRTEGETNVDDALGAMDDPS